MMKPKLTIAVRRGLKDIARIAESDIDAETGYEDKQFKGKRLRDISSALRWISCLDGPKTPPRVTRAGIAKHDEAVCIARQHSGRPQFR